MSRSSTGHDPGPPRSVVSNALPGERTSLGVTHSPLLPPPPRPPGERLRSSRGNGGTAAIGNGGNGCDRKWGERLKDSGIEGVEEGGGSARKSNLPGEGRAEPGRLPIRLAGGVRVLRGGQRRSRSLPGGEGRAERSLIALGVVTRRGPLLPDKGESGGVRAPPPPPGSLRAGVSLAGALFFFPVPRVSVSASAAVCQLLR